MYKVGYIDDENDLISDYTKRLERRDIELTVAPIGDYFFRNFGMNYIFMPPSTWIT